MKSFKSYNSIEVEKIPRTQGIYAFYLNVISHEKVGLLGQEPFSDEKLIKVKKILNRKLKMVLEFMHSSDMIGALSSKEVTKNIEAGYSLSAKREIPKTIFEKIEDLKIQEIPRFLSLVKDVALFSQPIYVGITEKQTLYDRYKQHMSNYESSPCGNNFGSRLSEAGFDWDDLLFTCVEFDKSEEEMSLLTVIEKYLLIISKPVLSIR